MFNKDMVFKVDTNMKAEVMESFLTLERRLPSKVEARILERRREERRRILNLTEGGDEPDSEGCGFKG